MAVDAKSVDQTFPSKSRIATQSKVFAYKSKSTTPHYNDSSGRSDCQEYTGRPMGQRAYLTCDPCHALVKLRHQARQHFDRGIDRHAVRHGLWTSDSGRGTGFGTVGLLYGPSGSGKSSLVKAGLIPNLSSEVIAIYVEATPEETERRILRQLHKRIPELPTELRLVA